MRMYLAQVINWNSRLVTCSSSDELCHLTLISIIEKVPMKNLVGHVVSNILFSCLRLSQKDSNSTLSGYIAFVTLVMWFAFLRIFYFMHLRVVDCQVIFMYLLSVLHFCFHFFLHIIFSIALKGCQCEHSYTIIVCLLVILFVQTIWIAYRKLGQEDFGCY